MSPLAALRGFGAVVTLGMCVNAFALVAMCATASAVAQSTFRISQVFSNLDGSVQYVALTESAGLDNQGIFKGLTLTITHAGVVKQECGTFSSIDFDGQFTPVYRLWNARAANHRYTTSTAIRDAMLAEGWVPEGYGPLGIAMCI